MHDVVVLNSGGLLMEVLQGGSNFSVGERQLICMARAILRSAKILILDEASASIDPNTDRILQETIRNQFVGCTVLAIAHRIDTIIAFDNVIVMDSGKVVEFGAPGILRKGGGAFASLCRRVNL
jgi:ABC-type multidrug transport system fused ATPase/permease subunit